MEVNAKDWMEDIDSKATENALQIALLKQEVRNNHEAVMRNSDVRLEAIMERFDRLEQGAGWKMWAKLGSMLVVLSTAVWFTVVAPIHDDVAALERRMLDAEKRMPSIIAESD